MLAHKPLLIALIVVVVLGIGGIVDFAANNGRAYAGIKVNGVDVGGLTAEEMKEKLEQTFGKNVETSRIVLRDVGIDLGTSSQEEESEEEYTWDEEEAEAQPAKREWEATQITTGASLPIDEVVEEAMAIGREEGGFPARFGLLLGGRDLPLEVEFDEEKLESFLLGIDYEIGDVRSDATVVVEDGQARAVEGHDGSMVDRDWIRSELAARMISDDKKESTVPITPASSPSRTTYEQAEKAAELVNKAIANGATFSFESSDWSADRSELGSWVTAKTIEEGDGYAIGLGVDQNVATQAIFSNLDAHVTADDVKITFEVDDDGQVFVHTVGSAPIPDVPTAIDNLSEALFGTNGTAYAGGSPRIEIGKTDAPETLTFDQAQGLGIVSLLAEYTTEYSNDVGVENRNHNIHLVSDVLNNSVIAANGGWWSFNETSGDTNQDPPYASAGSIVGGEYVDSIGGGICQVATTVFNAFYEAGLDIPVRFNHTLYMSNYPDGRDASVSYPELDLQCENPLDSDVLLKMSYTDTTVTASLYGVETGYVVTTEPGMWEEGTKYTTVFEHDNSLSEGIYYKKKYGSDGSKYSVTRTVKDRDGNLVSVKTFTSVYQPQNEVYVVGPGVDTSTLTRDSSSSSSNAYDYGATTTTDSYGYGYGYGTDAGTGTAYGSDTAYATGTGADASGLYGDAA